MRGDGATAHVLGHQQVRPPYSLLHQVAVAGVDGCDNIDTLGETGDLDDVGVTQEDVEPYGHAEHVGHVVDLLVALRPGIPLRIPDVPFVEADLDRLGDLLVEAGFVDHRLRPHDAPLGNLWGMHGHLMALLLAVQVDRVVVHPRDALVEDVGVPVIVPMLAAEDKLDGRVEEPDGFRPLNRHRHVDLLRHLSDLPVTIDLVAQTPVFNIMRLLVPVTPTKVGVVGIRVAVAVLDPCQGLSKIAGSHVQAEEGLNLGLPTPLDELIRPKGIGLRL